jgi:hypothetical protein
MLPGVGDRLPWVGKKSISLILTEEGFACIPVPTMPRVNTSIGERCFDGAPMTTR